MADSHTGAAERDLLAPGDHDVDSTVVCVLTRFGLKRPWHLLQTYVSYRWVVRKLRRDPPDGFLHAAFLMENPTACYSLSLWTGEAAIAGFGTSVAEHVDVARSVFGRLRSRSGEPEIWSTKWRLFRVSRNLRWEGFDLRRVLTSQELPVGPPLGPERGAPASSAPAESAEGSWGTPRSEGAGRRGQQQGRGRGQGQGQGQLLRHDGHERHEQGVRG